MGRKVPSPPVARLQEGVLLSVAQHLPWLLSLPQARLAALADQWQFLVQKSAEKSQKLKEANKQQNFNTGIKDFDFWLSEVMAGFPSHHWRISGRLG